MVILTYMIGFVTWPPLPSTLYEAAVYGLANSLSYMMIYKGSKLAVAFKGHIMFSVGL